METPLSTETLTDVFCFLTRKELCQLIYPVSRQVYKIATSSHLVPVIHLNPLMSIWSDRIDKANNSGYNCFISIDSTLSMEEFLSTIPNPGKFVRFQEIEIQGFLPQPLLEFLRNASESFTSCELILFIQSCDWIAGVEKLDQIKYLLRYVFHSPFSVVLGACHEPWQAHGMAHDMSNIPLLHEAVIPKCSRLMICFEESDICTAETNNALWDWLMGKPNPQTDLHYNGKKHLVLRDYPAKSALDLIEQIKDTFQNTTVIPIPDIVITFYDAVYIFRERSRVYSDQLDEKHLFSMDKPLTTQRLSLLRYVIWKEGTAYAYRLWWRQVLNETEDSANYSMLSGEGSFDLEFKYAYRLYHNFH
ncbi:hypothetical protein DdX_16093 [Ditylenchus destructor]|uniref:F-box domain-containing protein n=1 Tax=Ditylenchus destructor TaxID=166010 RepID=A0AAD4MP43_9BILA|nr:hypothetical protein DdX_16093 [Ditylenchus destructor]